MRRTVFIILVIVFSAIFYFSTVENENSFAHQTRNVIREIRGVKKPEVTSQALPQNVTNPISSDSSQAGALANMDVVQFNNWVRTEAKAMDTTSNNTAEIEVRLRAQARTLTSAQIVEMVSVAHTLYRPANERIFVSYMATLIPTPEGVNAQFEIAKKALPDFGAVLPHSEAEIRHGQEMSIRFMQVDELFARAKTDANALDKLKLLVAQAEAPQVRDYAARKLKELNL